MSLSAWARHEWTDSSGLAPRDIGDCVRLAKEFGLWVVRHFEIDETIANADYAAPARRFRQFAEAECRGLPALYEHLALSIAMDAELRALAVHPNERPLGLIECGTPTGLNLMWNQYAIAMVRTSCTGTANASGQPIR